MSRVLFQLQHAWVVMLLMCLAVDLVNVHAVTTSASKFKACRYNPKGICLDLTIYHCPVGHRIRHLGCGLGEVCCLPFVEGKPKFEIGNDQCGVTSVNAKSRIVGGKSVTIRHYPWTVSIQKWDQPVCGGSIVGDRWILTAAHCVEKNSDLITVVIGSSISRLSLSQYTKRHQIDSVYMYKDYVKKHPEQGHDIALIKLSKILDIGGTLTRKVCLPAKEESFEDHVCVALGWGYTHEPKENPTTAGMSTVLQMANLPVVRKFTCQHLLKKLLANDTICAGYRAGREDSCQGDSGGPLVCQDKNGLWKQAGIVSVGKGCGRWHSMGVYTEVSAYVEWIQDTIKQNP